MDFEVLKTVLRQVLIAIGTALASVGVIQQSWIEPLVGVTVAIAAALWGIFAKKKDQAIIKAAE